MAIKFVDETDLSTVGNAIVNKGWIHEEYIEKINFADYLPVDICQPECIEYISTNIARIAYDYIVCEGNL